MLKNELTHHHTYQPQEEVGRNIFAFMEGLHDRKRQHQSLGYLSPLEFERQIGES